VPHYPNTGRYTFQVILYSNGAIKFQYKDMGNGGSLTSATVGINRDAQAGLQIAYNQPYVTDHLAVLITRGGGTQSWLSVDCSAPFTVAPGASHQCVITANAAQLNAGTYRGTIRIRSDDPDEPEVTVTVNLTVEAPIFQALSNGSKLQITKINVYPNPATDTNSVHFSLEGVGIARIRIQIFALNGKLVYDSGLVENGFVWHLQNDQGETLANGVYLYIVYVEGIDGTTHKIGKLGKLCILR